jgi:hypothetical protein
VVLAPETPLFVVLSERAFDIETAVPVSSTVIDRFVQKCLGATRGKLGDLSGDVWSRHAQAVFFSVGVVAWALNAQLRRAFARPVVGELLAEVFQFEL